MEEMGRVGQLLTAMKADVSEVKEANVGLITDVDNVLLSDRGQKTDKTAMKCEELHQAAEDATNRDRHENLQVIGLKERMENGKLSDCVKTIISNALDVELDGSQLQRVHQAQYLKKAARQRPINIRFLELERVLAAVKEKYKNKEVVKKKKNVVCGKRMKFTDDREVMDRTFLYSLFFYV